jgi:hypothetical protein
MSKAIRILKKIGKVLLILIIAFFVIHSAFSFILGHRVEAQLRAIKARGEPVAMTDLGLPKVPDSENGAPFYEQAFKELERLSPDECNPPPMLTKAPPPGAPPVNASPGMPVSGQPPGAPVFKSDITVIGDFMDSEERAKDPSLWDKAQQIVDKHGETLALAEQAASKPKCQFPTNWEDGAGALFTYFPDIRKLTRLAAASALLDARAGRTDEAIRSIELSFKMSESLKDEPTIIGQLVRIAMLKITSSSLREVLAYGDIGEAQARRLYDYMGKIDLYPGWNRAMLGERAFGIWGFNSVRKSGFEQLFGGLEIPQPSGMFLIRPLLSVAGPVLYADELVYLRLMNKQLERTRHSVLYMKNHDPGFDQELSLPFYAVLSKTVFPVFIRATIRRDTGEAEVDGSRIFLALIAYKDRFGAYPASLDELRAGLGWDIPKDIFSDKDFIYKRRGNGFLLYSIGENFKDDGGRPKPVPTDPASNDENYDIIWKMNR